MTDTAPAAPLAGAHATGLTGSEALHLFALLTLFAASGFAGLIYESTWTRYLGLFLGHAALAQTLVLAIFMGGMALGAWLAGRYSVRATRLLLAYALVEAGIGLMALGFHPAYSGFVDLSYERVIPALDLPLAVALYKWAGAAALIALQSVLLGMTFPLLAAGLMRRHPRRRGRLLSLLYFVNSLGAALGVLASGFWLIDAWGLPGTLHIAGIINFCVAAGAALLAGRLRGESEAERALEDTSGGTSGGSAPGHRPRLLLLAALVTGLASFIYEVVWLRMLSLVLSSSSHAFELMLSAFILGLAAGGWWMRRRLDGLTDPVASLARVQLAMGALALLTLPVYKLSYAAMAYIVRLLPRDASGYDVFNVASHAISMAVMFPATFCAGMTLPLVTYGLLRQGAGERCIGAVYAWNTVGAIAGVFIAVHLGFPLFGLKGTLALGALLDIGLGLVLLYVLATRPLRFSARALAVTAPATAVAVLLMVALDPHQLASGVYRRGAVLDPAMEIRFHEDGKAASIDTIYYPQAGTLTVTTNGKPDASIMMHPERPPTSDQSTMVLAGLLPLALHPQARRVANIGLGSGLTAHALLADERLERVDTIEIEPAMVRASRGFGAEVGRTYQDPRSHIFIDDARSWFAARGARYDVIISEPSNPWVSGVAGLFSTEFYRHVRRYLADDGLLVQWFQLYETDTGLVASVLKAVQENFPDYELYAANALDLLIVARKGGLVGEPDDARLFGQPAVAAELRKVGVHSLDDLRLRRIAGRGLLEPLLRFFPEPANSDYYPFLDQRAARARFMGRTAAEFTRLRQAPLPVLDWLEGREVAAGGAAIFPDAYYPPAQALVAARAQAARLLVDAGAADSLPDGAMLKAAARQRLAYLRLLRGRCDPDLQLVIEQLLALAGETLPYLPRDEAVNLWRRLDQDICPGAAEDGRPVRDWLALFVALAGHRPAQVAELSGRLLEQPDNRAAGRQSFLLMARLLGQLGDGRPRAALQAWRRWSGGVFSRTRHDLPLLLLAAQASFRAARGDTVPGAAPLVEQKSLTIRENPDISKL